jgi:hypothetical protein
VTDHPGDLSVDAKTMMKEEKSRLEGDLAVEKAEEKKANAEVREMRKFTFSKLAASGGTSITLFVLTIFLIVKLKK